VIQRHLNPRSAGGFLIAAVIATALPFVALPAHADPLTASVRVPQADQREVRFYVVKESFNGEPEFLFAIAQRYLGDGNRFEEIFELNKGRRQPDGSALTVPTSLNPGWILLLPDDARGPGVQVGRLASGEEEPRSQQRPTSPQQQNPRNSEQPPAQPRPTQVAPDRQVPPRGDAAETPGGSRGLPVVGAVSIAVASAAAIAAGTVFGILRWRRRAARTAGGGAYVRDSSASWTIDSALRIAVAASQAEQIAFPGVYVVTVDDTSIHLHLTAPSTRAPAGWTSSPDGRTWSAALAYLQRQPVPDTSDTRFSGLAALGATESGRLLLDFAQARGPVSVEGPADAVDDVVDAWVVELTSNPWSASPHVAHITTRGANRAAALDDFIAGAGMDTHERGVAVIDEIATRAQGDALRALFANPDFHWIVLVKSSFAGASWRFSVRDGVLSSDLLPDVRYTASSERTNA